MSDFIAQNGDIRREMKIIHDQFESGMEGMKGIKGELQSQTNVLSRQDEILCSKASKIALSDLQQSLLRLLKTTNTGLESARKDIE